MNLCQEHWDKLKRLIDERGLTQFVAKSGEQAMKRFVAEVEKTAEGKGDPLMNAAMAIFNNALGIVGLSLLNPGPDGRPPCPICVLKTCECGNPECATRFEGWIEKAADEQKAFFSDKIARS